MSNGDSLDFPRKYIDKKNVFKRNENNYGKIYFVSMVNKQKIENNIIYSFNSNEFKFCTQYNDCEFENKYIENCCYGIKT